jgi:hypothetical protein
MAVFHLNFTIFGFIDLTVFMVMYTYVQAFDHLGSVTLHGLSFDDYLEEVSMTTMNC